MANDPFNDALELDPLYQPSERFLRAFYEFGYRLNSLQRHWEFTRRFIAGYLTDLQAAKTDGSGEMEMIKDELFLSDEEYFPEFLRGAVITHGLALLENLLSDVAREVATELGANPELDQRQLPYVNRYILFLTRTCGLELEVNKDLWRNLDAIRELRNRYIHKLDRDLPSQIKATLTRVVDETQSDEKRVDDAFVDFGLKVVAELAERVESSYWRWFEKREGHPHA
jgi:hypothetical protein